jgi:hypothetical protein
MGELQHDRAGKRGFIPKKKGQFLFKKHFNKLGPFIQLLCVIDRFLEQAGGIIS